MKSPQRTLDYFTTNSTTERGKGQHSTMRQHSTVGVHLEDSSSGSRGWTENDLEYFIKQLTNPQLYSTNKASSTSSNWSSTTHHQQVTTHTTSTFHSADSLSTNLRDKCHISTPSNLRTRVVAPFESQIGSDSCLCHEKTKKSKSRTLLKINKDHKTRSSKYDDSLEVSVDSVLDEDFSSKRPQSCKDIFCTTNTTTTNITSCTGSGYCVHFADSCSDDPDSSESPHQQVSKSDKNTDGSKKEHKRRFFHRMIPRPLRRSHSCGTAKDLTTTSKSKTTEIELTTEKVVCEGKNSSIRKTSSFDARTLYLPDDLDGTTSKPKSRNLAWNVKRKLHFLRRHHTDSSLTERFPKVNMVNAAKWGKSFDALIRDKDGLEIFRKYMRSEFSDENIDFWLAVEDYRASDESEFEKKANIIFKTFVAKSAARAVNLRAPNREKVRQKVETGVSRNTFDDSQKEIFDFMQRDTYQRFLKSEMYANACKS